MRTPARCLVLSLALLLGACASGPEYWQVRSGIAPVPADMGRVYFYRTQTFAPALQPMISVNGRPTMRCKPNGVFYEELPPGEYTASVETEVERSISFDLAPGEEKYVRCHTTMGVLVGRGHLELVGHDTGRNEIQGLSFMGAQSASPS